MTRRTFALPLTAAAALLGLSPVLPLVPPAVSQAFGQEAAAPAPAPSDPAPSDLAMTGTAADPLAAAQAMVAAWCAAVMSLDEGAATALMSPDLQQDVAFARTASDAFAAAHPDEKPPLGDGLPLTAFADRVVDCAASDVGPGGALMTFTAGGGGTATWTDAIEFVPGPDGKLMIGDVLYAPERVVRLSDALTAIAETGE